MRVEIYLNNIKGGVYKILPLWEEEHDGADVHLDIYLSMLVDEMTGALSTFPILQEDPQYLEVVSHIHAMRSDNMDQTTCKRKVFHMLSCLEKSEARYHV